MNYNLNDCDRPSSGHDEFLFGNRRSFPPNAGMVKAIEQAEPFNLCEFLHLLIECGRATFEELEQELANLGEEYKQQYFAQMEKRLKAEHLARFAAKQRTGSEARNGR